ncbi:MAG: three-Cys-motif partner protein TcmP [Candidatus Gastranaerophilales bacterium]|nr:three-Cys-motif partner protein TcmP [Candidatus Gastranaerophilales bacterium]
MVKTAKEHFTEEKKHTKIKHDLFAEALKASLSISNSLNYKDSSNIPFMYIDLYAGAGKFTDEKEGSPLIAINLISKYMEKRSFEHFEYIVTENDENNASCLSENIKSKKATLNITEKDLKTALYCGHWEDLTTELSKYIEARKWGFVFVDPFSLELNLQELINVLNHNIYYKDIMILINKNAQERVLGKPDSPDIQKVCRYFGIEEPKLKRLINYIKVNKKGTNEDIIQYLTQRALASVDKDFKIYAGISRTREGELENSDRFYLALLTSSIGVADSFLYKYAELLEEKELRNKGGQQNLFDASPQTKYIKIEESINDIISKNNNTITLYHLTKVLFNVFLSWKFTEDNQIPHRRALIIALNNLLNQRDITLEVIGTLPKGCINLEKNTILAKAFNSKENLKHIRIKSLNNR